MDSDRALVAARSPGRRGSGTRPTLEPALAISEVFFILALEGVAGRTQSKRKNLGPPATATQRAFPAESQMDSYLASPISVVPVSGKEAAQLAQRYHHGGPVLYVRGDTP